MRTELETKKYAMGIHIGTRNELEQKWVYKHINTTYILYYLKIRHISMKMKMTKHTCILLGNINYYHADFQHGKTMLGFLFHAGGPPSQ